MMYNSRSDRQHQKGEVISQSFLAATFSGSFQSLAGFFPLLVFFFLRVSNKSLSTTSN